MRIGILAVQGAFIEHKKMLDTLGVENFEIRQKKDLVAPFDGFIIPGGESTVIGKLLSELDLLVPLKNMILKGMPVFGTCAGLILLAKELVDQPVKHLATMDIVAKRNAYGRQLGSFSINSEFKGIGKIPMTFIRAPYIVSVNKDTKVLAKVQGHIVAARQQYQLVTAFHPELTNDTSVHEYFIHLVQSKMEEKTRTNSLCTV